MNNDTQNIEKYLTKSAKEELERILLKEKESLLNKAEKIAKSQLKSEQLEISLRDIIEANDEDIIRKERASKTEKRKENLRKVAVLSGMIYTILGVVIYLSQNKNFDLGNNLGLLIALTGASLVILTFLLYDFAPIRFKRKTLNYTLIKEDSSDDALVIIGRWMIIEKMLSKKIEAQTGKRVSSFNQIITYLNSDDFDPELALTIKNLLKTRNAVAHNRIETSESLVKGYIHLSGSVIEQLEDKHTFRSR